MFLLLPGFLPRTIRDGMPLAGTARRMDDAAVQRLSGSLDPCRQRLPEYDSARRSGIGIIRLGTPRKSDGLLPADGPGRLRSPYRLQRMPPGFAGDSAAVVADGPAQYVIPRSPVGATRNRSRVDRISLTVSNASPIPRPCGARNDIK